jgi:hypothetical protein
MEAKADVLTPTYQRGLDIEVAREAGHSPTMALATYGHVIEELEGAERRPASGVAWFCLATLKD